MRAHNEKAIPVANTLEETLASTSKHSCFSSSFHCDGFVNNIKQQAGFHCGISLGTGGLLVAITHRGITQQKNNDIIPFVKVSHLIQRLCPMK